MNGQISYAAFQEQATTFHSASVRLGDSWELKTYSIVPGQTRIYLKKCCMISTQVETMTESTINVPDQLPDDSERGDINGYNFCEDMSTADVDCEISNSSEKTLIQAEYHIVYSDSYSVPVLYFNAHHITGQSLLHHELGLLFSSFHAATMKNQIWTTLTQVEHPILQTPFFMLHPCKTAALMSNVTPTASVKVKEGTYLVQWMSSICPAVGLPIQLNYITF